MLDKLGTFLVLFFSEGQLLRPLVSFLTKCQNILIIEMSKFSTESLICIKNQINSEATEVFYNRFNEFTNFGFFIPL